MPLALRRNTKKMLSKVSTSLNKNVDTSQEIRISQVLIDYCCHIFIYFVLYFHGWVIFHTHRQCIFHEASRHFTIFDSSAAMKTIIVCFIQNPYSSNSNKLIDINRNLKSLHIVRIIYHIIYACFSLQTIMNQHFLQNQPSETTEESAAGLCRHLRDVQLRFVKQHSVSCCGRYGGMTPVQGKARELTGM